MDVDPTPTGPIPLGLAPVGPTPVGPTPLGPHPAEAHPTASTATASTATGHRVGLRTLLTLFAGRGSFRLVQLMATVLLLPLWGNDRYGVFAAAVATFSFLISLLQSGPEKTVLKLLPRAPRSGPLILEAIAALLWCLPLPILITFAVTIVLDGTGPVSVYVGVAATAVGSGTLLLLAGLHRVTGRIHYDARSALAMTVIQLLTLGLVVLGLGPVGYLAVYVSLQTAVNVFLLIKLGRPSLRIRRRPGFLRRVVWTTALMGSPEVCMFLVSTVVFPLLAASRWSAQVGQLFAVTLVWSAGITFVLYGLRVYAPHTSLTLLGNSAAGRTRAARIAAGVLIYDIIWLTVLAVVVASTGLQDLLVSSDAFLGWAVLLLTRAPSDVMLITAGFLLENSDARSTSITAGAAVAALVVAAAAGAVVIPGYGGAGLMAVVVLGEAIQATMFVLFLWRRSRARHPLDRHVGSEAA